MEAYVVDWLSLVGRWVHLVTGIAWIGASFYFVWLDNHLEPPKQQADVDRGVGGEVWSVHGGGFYHAQKYKLTPPKLPETLHWFKWEAYSTWLSGIFLLILIYWYSAEVYLIDTRISDISKPIAITIGITSLIGGWIVYDLLCKSPLGQKDSTLGIVLFVFVVVAAFLLCQVFSGRGAFIHFGAMLGTIMVANVAMVIIPGQKELVNATKEGRDPDPKHGIKGKQRSVHNTYFTLPVLFVMISNHYAMTYGHEYNWLILVALSLAGALVRVYFVARHSGRASPIPLVISVILLLGVAAAIVPGSAATKSIEATSKLSFAQVESVIKQRCASCHASQPTQPGFTGAPAGIVFDSAKDIVNQAIQIHQQTVVSKVMPIGNLTGMTEEERSLIDSWFKAGAKID
ncbi:MAG: urate hydroxylase PuuD [Arenicellales bacterium]|nr:urate hydroxylase PuuD [Arenicellales bacterium]